MWLLSAGADSAIYHCVRALNGIIIAYENYEYRAGRIVVLGVRSKERKFKFFQISFNLSLS
jgi:hypothetical protein